jgi:hypothetical protein
MKINNTLNCASPNCAVPSKNSTSLNNSQPLLNKSCCGDSVQFGANVPKGVFKGTLPKGSASADIYEVLSKQGIEGLIEYTKAALVRAN